MFREHDGCQKAKCSESIVAVGKQKMLKGHSNCLREKMVNTKQGYAQVVMVANKKKLPGKPMMVNCDDT